MGTGSLVVYFRHNFLGATGQGIGQRGGSSEAEPSFSIRRGDLDQGHINGGRTLGEKIQGYPNSEPG